MAAIRPQDLPNQATPVRLVTADGAAFYTAAGGGSESGTPLGYQQLTGLGTAQSLTVPAGATMASILVEGAPVRWRDDGVAPTASVGMPLAPGGAVFQYDAALAAIQFIQQSAGAVVNVSYYS